MHPLHQAIKEEEKRQSAAEGLTILFGVPLALCYLVAILFPFLVLRNENVDGITFGILSFLNAICGAVIGFLGACGLAWNRKLKRAAGFLASGLLLWFFAVLMFRLAVFVYGIPLGKPVIIGRTVTNHPFKNPVKVAETPSPAEGFPVPSLSSVPTFTVRHVHAPDAIH